MADWLAVLKAARKESETAVYLAYPKAVLME
jgi:hypothetical protein